MDIALLSQKDAFACVNFAFCLNAVAYAQHPPIYGMIRGRQIKVRVKLTESFPDQIPTVFLREGRTQRFNGMSIDVHAIGVRIMDRRTDIFRETHHFIHYILRYAQNLTSYVLSIEVSIDLLI